jgi:hypothetical protein
MADTMLSAGVVPNYAADPAVLGPVALGTCSVADIRLFLPGTDIEVIPSGYTLGVGTVTFSIPWCRLVAEAYLDNPESGWDYADVATWGAPAVDVRCISNDPSTHAVLVWRNACGTMCAQSGCTDYRQTACMYLQSPKLGIVDVSRADYTSGAWVRRATGRCDLPDWVDLHYLAGMTPITKQAIDATIRLAHAKMPDEPCGCAVTQRLWARDRTVPQVLTAERENCPFGMSDGAWTAYRFAAAMRIIRGGEPL